MSEQAKPAPAAQVPDPLPKHAGGLGGENARGEVAGCPTGLADSEQAEITRQPGGGGAPTTGAVDPSAPPSPGEGVTEKQIKGSGGDGRKG
jgi:hypothetical protein